MKARNSVVDIGIIGGADKYIYYICRNAGGDYGGRGIGGGSSCPGDCDCGFDKA